LTVALDHHDIIVRMSQSSWKQVRGIMMTSERIEAYGGIAFPAEFLERAALSVRSGAVPLHADHDLAQPVRTRNPDAFVEMRPDGVSELHTVFEIHSDDMKLLNTRSGLSVMVTVPIARPAGYVDPIEPDLHMSADHAWYPDQVLLAAESALSEAGIASARISTERAYQFSFVPDPQIYITIGISLLTGVGSSAIWAAIAKLFRGRQTPPGASADTLTTINLTVVNGDSSVRGIIRTDSEEVALRAVQQLGTMSESIRVDPEDSNSATSESRPISESSVVTWDEQSSRWTPPG
jgi:hypothetical protein